MARKIKHRKFKLSESRKKYVKNRTTTLNGEPVRMNPRTADRYALEVEKEVRKMHLDVSSQVEKLFDSPTAKKSVAMDASISSQARILMNKLIDKWTKRFNRFGINWTDDMMDDVTEQSGKDLSKSLEKLSGGLTINTSTISPRTNDIIIASTDQSASLIKTIAPDYTTEVKEAVMRSITDDTKSFTELKNSIHEMLQSRYKKYKNKAKNTALDQTRKAYNSITRSRMRDAGITHFKWNHSGGSVKPRDYHRDELNGKVFDVNDPPVIDKNTGEIGFPGQLVNCFPGESIVDYFFGVKRAFRHFYRGESTELITDNGSVIKSTPNHPILTQRGWVAACDVNCSDYVIEISNDGFNGSECNGDNFKSRISDVFYSLSLIGIVESSRSTGGELHNDVVDEKIDIINSNWELLNNSKTILSKECCEFIFSMPLKKFNAGSGYRSLFKFIKGSTFAPDSIVSGLCEILSIGLAELGHSDFTGFTRAPNFKSILLEKLNNNTSGNADYLSNLLNANAFGVELFNQVAWNLLSSLRAAFPLWNNETSLSEFNTEIIGVATELGSTVFEGKTRFNELSRVVDKRRGELFAHVYNLEMDNGLYYTQNIAVSNCKCFQTPVIKFDDGKPD